jgi:pyruvate kinase
MLSGETASGKHPVKCVEMMDRILRSTEAHNARLGECTEGAVHNEREARAQAAVTLANSTHAKAIVVITKSGQTAREIAKFRPRIPVIAFAPTASVCQKLSLNFGVFAICAAFTDPETTIATGIAAARKAGLLHVDMRVVLVSDAPAKNRSVSTIQMRTIA